MLDIKVNLGLIIVDLLLYIFGILTWFSSNFAHELGLFGLGRFFAGLVAFIIGFIVTMIIVKSG